MPNNQIQSLTVDGITYDIVDKTSGYLTSSSASLSGLNDTTITSPSNGQVLTYDSATSKWVNGATSGCNCEPEDDILVLNLLTEYGYVAPSSGSDGYVITESVNLSALVGTAVVGSAVVGNESTDYTERIILG